MILEIARGAGPLKQLKQYSVKKINKLTTHALRESQALKEF